jgi:hypothetical protein
VSSLSRAATPNAAARHRTLESRLGPLLVIGGVGIILLRVLPFMEQVAFLATATGVSLGVIVGRYTGRRAQNLP